MRAGDYDDRKSAHTNFLEVLMFLSCIFEVYNLKECFKVGRINLGLKELTGELIWFDHALD